MKNTLLFLAVFLAVASGMFGQTALNSTTLAAALDASSRFMLVTDGTLVTTTPGNAVSTNAIGAPVASGQTMLLVGKEIFFAIAITAPTTNGVSRFIEVRRGSQGTRAVAHPSAAVVVFGPPNAFVTYDPSGACNRTLASFVPLINVANGKAFDCAAGQWGNFTDTPQVGTVIASQAGAMTGAYAIIAKITHISGTEEISDFTLPVGLPDGGTFILIPDGVFTTTATGVIGKATTAVVGKALTYTYDLAAGIIYPSY